jgi:hypothetical protein
LCDLGLTLGELALLARRRSPQATADLNAYLDTPEFERCLALVETIIHTERTLGRKLFLPRIARELDVPPDIALMVINRFGVSVGDVRME